MGTFYKIDNFIAGRNFDHKQFLCSEVSPLSLSALPDTRRSQITTTVGIKSMQSCHSLRIYRYLRTREHLLKLIQNLIKTENKAGPKRD